MEEELGVPTVAQLPSGKPIGAGYRHQNLKSEFRGTTALLRIPINQRDDVDLRVWPEREVLTVANRHRCPAPAVLAACGDALILEFVPGKSVEARWPRGHRLPTRVISDVADLIARLQAIPYRDLPSLPPSWPADGDTGAFMSLIVATTSSVFAELRREFASLYSALRVPSDPLAPLADLPGDLTTRPFAFCHGDLNRGNIIRGADSTVFIDWELALYGDPAYEIAAHFHRAGYQPLEEEHLLARLRDVLPPRALMSLTMDVAAYRIHEQIKSVLVDAPRYQRQVSNAATEAVCNDLTKRLLRKLNRAATIWGLPAYREDDVASALIG